MRPTRVIHLPTCLAAAFVLAAMPPALAQTANSRSAQPTLDGPTFARRVAACDLFEIQSSGLADARAASDDIKSFARQLIADHDKAAADLETAAQQSGMTLAVPALDRRQQAALRTLAGTKGRRFDEAFATAQMQAHREAVRMFSSYAGTGDLEPFKSFAAAQLPALQQHLAQAEKLAARK